MVALVKEAREKADRILLMDHQIGERGGERHGVIELGRQIRLIGISHRRARVDQKVAGQVRFGLVFPDVVLVGLRVDEPVDFAWVVPRDVLSMFAELDRKAVEGAGVKSLDEPLGDELRFQVEAFDRLDRFRVEIRRGFHRRAYLFTYFGAAGRGTDSRSFSMIRSFVSPSACA